MPLVNMKDMLSHAYDNQYAVGAFDLVNLDFLQGILEAAERTRAPVILSLAESHFEYFDFELIMAATETSAMRATVPVAVHLDHGASLASAVKSIRLGCNGVMVDGSHLPFEENVNETRAVVEMAGGCGVPVEGELGYVPGVEGEDAEKHPGEVRYTTVDEARDYVAQTGVDFLAVSIGTIHGRMKGEPQLDIERLGEINAALKIPLVIHGGTGLSDAQYADLVRNGVAKINYYTALSDKSGLKIMSNVASGGVSGYAQLTRGTIEVIADETERMIRLWGSAGRADAVLENCAAWSPVEHLIIFNTEGLDEAGAKELMAEGTRILSQVPGVRSVETGHAITDGAQYRYAWFIRFCHPNVIESYKHHPDHVAFADNHFRPVAGDRISIDYQHLD